MPLLRKKIRSGKTKNAAFSSRNRAYLSIYFSNPDDRDLILRAAKLMERDPSPFVVAEMRRIAERVIEKHEGKCAHCGSKRAA